MKSRTNRVAVATIALCAASCSAMPQSGENWQSLFDGKTLDGWTPKIRGFPLGENYRDTFRVRDGAIVVSYDKYEQFGERFGHLFYKAPFKAYRFRMEYRFLSDHPADTPAWAIANSGVMIFSQDPKTMAVGDSFPVSVEAQLLGPAPGQTRFNGNMCSPGTHVVMDGQLVTTHCINSKTPSGPNDVWTQFEIEVTPAGVVTQKINGATTIVYSQVQLDPVGGMANSKPLVEAAGGKVMLDGGYISLQSEGNPIEFRKIEILELR
ncbi:MAG: DUF1080 domain-containing protein [Hyphomonadaceae bacterium]|nr:DUF1080 domain-containing protein [Hyphomonadaceae bacterium]